MDLLENQCVAGGVPPVGTIRPPLLRPTIRCPTARSVDPGVILSCDLLNQRQIVSVEAGQILPVIVVSVEPTDRHVVSSAVLGFVFPDGRSHAPHTEFVAWSWSVLPCQFPFCEGKGETTASCWVRSRGCEKESGWLAGRPREPQILHHRPLGEDRQTRQRRETDHMGLLVDVRRKEQRTITVHFISPSHSSENASAEEKKHIGECELIASPDRHPVEAVSCQNVRQTFEAREGRPHGSVGEGDGGPPPPQLHS